jgi:hypothetical protein
MMGVPTILVVTNRNVAQFAAVPSLLAKVPLVAVSLLQGASFLTLCPQLTLGAICRRFGPNRPPKQGYEVNKFSAYHFSRS